MRLLRIPTYYDHYWRQFYLARPGLEAAPYETQLEQIHLDAFFNADADTKALTCLGYECVEFPYDVVPLQKAWAKENGIGWDPLTFKNIHSLEMVKRVKPDIIYIVNAEHGQDWIAQAREASKVRLIMRWCGVSVAPETLRPYDLVLTCNQGLANPFEQAGLKVKLVPFAFDVDVLSRINTSAKRDIPLSFIGSLNQGQGYHLKRVEVVKKLLEAEALTLFTPDQKLPRKKEIEMRCAQALVSMARRVGISDSKISSLPGIGSKLLSAARIDLRMSGMISRFSKTPVYGMEMYDVMARSYSTFNMHLDATGEFVGNVRLFEASGAGSCLLTDEKADLSDYFEPDKEVVTFSTAAEAVEKAAWLRDHPEACVEIGKAAQRRVLKDHTYTNRAEKIDSLIKAELRTGSSG